MRCKQVFAGLFLCLAILAFSACSSGPTHDAAHTPYTPRQIAEVILAGQAEVSPLQVVTPADDFFWDYLFDVYRINVLPEDLVDGIIFFAGGVIAEEIAILQFADDVSLTPVRDTLQEYLDRRRVAFAGYAPLQAALLGDSIVRVHGNHVALLALEDPRSAETSFLSCFSETPPPLPDEHALPRITAISETREVNAAEQVFHRFDPEGILYAWETGDTSELSESNRRILDKCAEIIGQLITADMNAFEKQIAIVNWIIIWSVYDPEFFSNAPDAVPNPNNGNPYALLFDQVAICWGFTYTFQLFMDMLGVTCITVYGHDNTGGYHAWNMVYIDGVWYAVDLTLDVTLNNPLGVGTDHRPDSIEHRHLNVTSEWLYDLGHRWDQTTVPEATIFGPRWYVARDMQ
jgi:hypothetical protein